jgi:hypothetical protein
VKKAILHAAASLAVITACCLTGNCQGVASPQETFPGMNSALQAIEAKYHARIGVEYSSKDADRAAVILDFERDSLETTLNRLVAQKTDYKWTLRNSVYYVTPKNIRDSLLDVRVKSFSVAGLTPEGASAALSAVPEVKAWLRKHGVRRHELEVGSSSEKSNPRLSVSLKNTTVRDILNQLILKADRTNWTVVRYGQRSEYIGIYF